ncbi:DNA-processing protein DprA [Agromyces salentinus]|uniref:Smf/DprA SLOG domain-containing protein n=1 Tax=Agromyces salentinus TaxID=269421 RepID=A0ABN2MVH5_9MICO|nr:DNA-processing protein DprA [Agromyces salentinus]
MSDSAELEQIAALVALRFRAENALVPSVLRREFEDGRLPLEILERADPSALVAEDRTTELEWAMAQIRQWSEQNIEVLTPFSDQYPAQLRTVYDYPVILFARGSVRHDTRSAAIVGSREVSDWGLRFAANLGAALAEDGVTVVSGLARGVDGAAHTAALQAGGRTVAVLGNGLNYVYPREHRSLQGEIERTGLVLSQFLPDERPTRRSFPARNITMSAYSSITVIAEAAEKSGTRIQADAAVKHARPLVITTQVAAETSWGHHYASGQFDVTVVATAAEGRLAIQRILSRLHNHAPMAFPA